MRKNDKNSYRIIGPGVGASGTPVSIEILKIWVPDTEQILEVGYRWVFGYRWVPGKFSLVPTPVTLFYENSPRNRILARCNAFVANLCKQSSRA